MKAILKYSAFVMTFCMMSMLASCSPDDESSLNKEHDATLYGEWVRYNDGKRYIHDYYYFSSDGTGIQGSYESDIDWINEEDDITWYTIDDKYLYIDGRKQQYWCDGTTLSIGNKDYREL